MIEKYVYVGSAFEYFPDKLYNWSPWINGYFQFSETKSGASHLTQWLACPFNIFINDLLANIWKTFSGWMILS